MKNKQKVDIRAIAFHKKHQNKLRPNGSFVPLEALKKSLQTCKQLQIIGASGSK